VTLIYILGRGHVFSEIAVLFSKMAVVTFGEAYAVLAHVAQQAVENYYWLKPGEMLDGLGMAENDARPTDHGIAIRGIHGGIPRSQRTFPDACRHARWFARDLGDVPPASLWIFLGAPFIRNCAEMRASIRPFPRSRRRS
jgi:chromate transporter